MNDVGGSTIYSLHALHHVPCVIMQPLYIMYSLVLLKYVEQPWLQSWPMDRRDPDARVWKVCALRDLVGRARTPIIPSYVNCIVIFLGSRTVIGLLILMTFTNRMLM